jgi:dTMP kinase
MRGTLVCIVGIDGSGKTTLAKQLVAEMQAQGIKSRYVWGGFAPTIFLQPAIWLIKTLIYRENRHSYVSEHKGQVLKNRHLAATYYHIVLADHILQLAARVQWPLLLGESVVCDRYIQDAVVTTSLVLDYTDAELLRLLKRMLRFVPRPDRTLVADLPAEVAYERKDDVPSIAFLSERRKRYQLITEAYGLPVLDACQSPKVLVEHAAKVLQPNIGGT